MIVLVDHDEVAFVEANPGGGVKGGSSGTGIPLVRETAGKARLTEHLVGSLPVPVRERVPYEYPIVSRVGNSHLSRRPHVDASGAGKRRIERPSQPRIGQVIDVAFLPEDSFRFGEVVRRKIEDENPVVAAVNDDQLLVV